MKIIFLLIAAMLLSLSPQRPEAVSITCTPTQTLMLGVDSKGNIIRVENWDSLCTVTDESGKVLGKYAFQPTSQVPETKEQAEKVGQDMIRDIQQYLYDRRYSDSNL